MIRSRVTLLTGLLVAAMASGAFAQGMLVPSGKDSTLPPLAIKSQQVQINIENQVATTVVKQVFTNSTSRQLEANYVFPMPADATIRDFAMTVDGKRVSGELVEAAKAKQIYTQIVAQARDPGLLEHLGDNLFRVNIFPVPANGTQTVELTYSQLVPGSGGVFRYVYPLHTAGRASQVQDFFSISAKLVSKTPLKSIYSPTHSIGVSRKSDNEAVVGLEQNRAILDKDFSLYWTVSDKDFGLNAVTFRPKADEPGYLMLLLSPKSAVNEKEVIAKDVIFVFDTSGSMGGEKIEQAKKALKFCVETLNEKDRFSIVQFATDVTLYKPELIEASKANKEAVRDFINRLQAEGGTNIYEAIEKALDLAKPVPPGLQDGKAIPRPKVIVFMTDGRPTVNRTGSEEILSLLGGGKENEEAIRKLRDRIVPLPMLLENDQHPENAKARAVNAEIERQIAELSKSKPALPRIFTFGVGDDVNTKLLDKIAQTSGGSPEYVRPAEDIEVKVSDFFAKASHPVMTGLKLAFGGDVKVEQMFPQNLPDLYFGQQVVAFARYSGSGDVAVTLSGAVSNGTTEKFTYEVNLPKQGTANDFIEPLWAHRKVGYLLDQIRLNGESPELKDEVIRLSKHYKIQTPYTSYLVLEEQHRMQYLGRDKLAQAGGAGGGRDGGWSYDDRGVAVPDLKPAARPGDKDARTDPSSGPPAGRRGRQPGDSSPTPPATGTPPPPPSPTLPRVGPAGETPAADAPLPAPVVVAPGPAPAKPMTEGEKRDLDRLNKALDVSRKSGPGEGAANYDTGGVVVVSGAATSQPEAAAMKWRAEQKSGASNGKLAVNGGATLDEKSLRAESGETAVTLAKEMSKLKKAESAAGEAKDRTSRTVGDRTFYEVSGFWIDSKFDVPIKMTFVKWGSEAYFAIVSGHVELKDAFALGTRVILVTADGKALVVSDSDGVEKMTEQELKDLFTAAAKPADK